MENTTKEQKITTPVAIIVAGVLIMTAVLLTGGNREGVTKEKTLSEQVGVSKEKLVECIKETDTESLYTKIENSVEKAMKSVPDDQKGTPYSVVIGANGSKAEIRGAMSAEDVKRVIAGVSNGTVTNPYTGEIITSEEGDHIYGNPEATIKVIVYSDFECPYCKIFHKTMIGVVNESGGNVSFVFRHWPLHQNSVAKLIAAECVAKIKGNDAFWNYADLVFGLLKTENTSVSDQL